MKIGRLSFQILKRPPRPVKIIQMLIYGRTFYGLDDQNKVYELEYSGWKQLQNGYISESRSISDSQFVRIADNLEKIVNKRERKAKK